LQQGPSRCMRPHALAAPSGSAEIDLQRDLAPGAPIGPAGGCQCERVSQRLRSTPLNSSQPRRSFVCIQCVIEALITAADHPGLPPHLSCIRRRAVRVFQRPECVFAPPHRAQHAPCAATPCTRPTPPAATPSMQPCITPLPHPHRCRSRATRTPRPPQPHHALQPSLRRRAPRAAPTLLVAASPVRLSRRCGGGGGGGGGGG
jgi:hypothetical protein